SLGDISRGAPIGREGPPRSTDWPPEGQRAERAWGDDPSVREHVERLLEPIGVRAFGLRQCFEPVGDFVEAFAARGLRHARVHVRVLVRLAGNCGLQIVAARAHRKIGCGVADRGEIVEVPMGMAGFAFSRRAKNRRHVVLTLDVGLVGEIQITAVRLRFAGERILEILVRLRAFERFHATCSLVVRPRWRSAWDDAGNRRTRWSGHFAWPGKPCPMNYDKWPIDRAYRSIDQLVGRQGQEFDERIVPDELGEEARRLVVTTLGEVSAEQLADLPELFG